MSIFAGMIAVAGAVVAAEEKYFAPWAAAQLKTHLPKATALTLPPAYGAVLLVNLVGATMVLIVLGMRVGKARKSCKVDYPTMYATGTSKDAVKFNCVQRGHQQALETFPSYVAMSLVGGLRHPYAVSIMGVFWAIGRLRWATCYAEGGPEKRYGSPFAIFIWASLFVSLAATGSFALGLAGVM